MTVPAPADDLDVARFLARPALAVAPDLLGWVVRHGDVAVRLTEVEAYEGEDDPGSHAFRGPTPRTRVMFGPAGHWYVYFSYGMHHAMNVVCGHKGSASAVLLRAGEVVAGHDVVRERRGRVAERDWARGPGRLAATLGVGLDLGGTSVVDGPLTLTPGPAPADVSNGPRVGVSGPGGDGEAFPWRFWATGDRHVSAYRAATPRRRTP